MVDPYISIEIQSQDQDDTKASCEIGCRFRCGHRRFKELKYLTRFYFKNLF